MEFEEKRKLADKICRRKKIFENEQLREINQDFKDKIRNAYRYLKKLKEGFKSSTILCRDKNDRLTI